MARRWDGFELVLLLLGLAPALLAAHFWPAGPLAVLPYLAWAWFAAWRLAAGWGLSRWRAFLVGAAVTTLLGSAATETLPDCGTALLVVAGLAMLLLAWVPPALGGHSLEHRAARASLRTLLPATLTALGVAAMLAFLGPRLQEEPAAGPSVAAAAQPHTFIPLSMDPQGRRALLFSLRDEGDDHEHYSLWTLDARDGSVQRVYRGYPFLTTDWCPGGNQITFPASDRSWDEEDASFGVYAARWNGENVRRRLPPPTDGSTWLYPLWSKHKDLLAAWLLPSSAIGSPLLDVPETYIVPADSGEAKKAHVRGCRLALAGAWQAEDAGLYMVTERGVYLLRPDGRAKRLVPAGEAPLDPFPFVVPESVRPGGGGVAYLELTYRNNQIERMDLGLVDPRGRRARVLANIYPLGFAWSQDGRLLAAIEATRQDELVVHLLDVNERERQRVRTGLKLVAREYPIRTMFAPDGRNLLIEGQLTPDDVWAVAVLDVASGKAHLLDSTKGQMAIGWRADNKILVSDTASVSVVSLDGSLEPIYPKGGAEAVGPRLRSAAMELLAREPVLRIERACDWLVADRR